MEHSGPKSEEMRNVCSCRAVSAAYYALFRHINSSAAGLIAPNVPAETNYRIQRWFEHAEMKKVCGRFLQASLDQPLLNLIGNTASSEMQNVASSFNKLQEARHRADYDLSYMLSSEEARELVFIAASAMQSWDVIANSAEANIFILSLLMWKNWEKDR
jgi:hypothetical protein